MKIITSLVLAAIALIPAPLQAASVRSPDGQRVAYAVPRGSPRTLLTEVWTARADGGGKRRVGIFPGESGDLAFLPDDEGLLYLERSLSYPAFGSHLYGGREIPLARNRVWRIRADGSGEALWPLPDDLQPLGIAASPDGERLAVSGYRGELLDQGDRGLWVVDRRGSGVRLLNARVVGPVRWASGSGRILCSLEGSGRLRSVTVSVETGEVADVDTSHSALPLRDAEMGSDGSSRGAGDVYGFGSPESSDAEAAQRIDNSLLLPLRGVLDIILRGYHAMHQDDFQAGRREYEAAIRAFESLLKRPSGAGFPRASCLAYIQALKGRIGLGEAELKQAVCQDHLLVLGDLLSHYAQAHGHRLPSSLEDLRSWAEGQIEAPDAAIRSRDLRTLTQILRCPADPSPEWPIRYVYCPETGPGTPALTCLCHRGRLLHLVGAPGGYRVEVGGFSRDQMDSLDAVASHHLKAGEVDRAISLLAAAAHQRPRDAAIHLHLGHAALQARDYARAEEAFKAAASVSRGQALARAYFGLGMIAAERPKGLLTAIDYFQEALIQDRNYVDARYQMARARYRLWEYDARADIEAVLKADPHYAEAYLLMGNWYADLKEDYGQAIPWYAKYIAMRPDDSEGRRRLSVAYLKVKDYGKVLETLSGFVQAHPDAVEVMPIVAQACVKQEKLDTAQGFYRAYLSRIDPKERALYEDIGLIASGEELAECVPTSGAERDAFLKRFWNSRDPDLSTPVNERLLEHYRRVWYARQNFSGKQQPWDRRGEIYVRFGEPDHRTSSLMMNASQNLAVQRVKERMAVDIYGTEAFGETYLGPVFPVRSLTQDKGYNFGVPDKRPEYYIGPETDQSSQVGGAYTTMEESTKKETGNADTDTKPQSEADRSRPGEGGRAAVAPRRNSLAPRSPPEEPSSDPGEYRPVPVSGADVSRVPWESWVYTRIGDGIEITFTDEGSNGVYDYAPMPMQSEITTDQAARFARYAPRHLAERAVAVSPDFYAPEYDVAPFNFYFDLADFRGRDGRSVLEVYYGLPRAAARYVPGEDVTRLVVERQAALISTASDTVYRAAGDLVYEASGNQGGTGIVPDVARLEAPAGTYRLEVRARDRMTGRLGLYRKAVRVEPYGRERLQLSDLEMAWRIAEGQPGDKFSKGNLQVIPMPTRSFRKGQSVFIYYEVYNLKPDGEGQTKYQVEYTIGQKERGIISRLVRTFVGKREEVAVGYEGRGFREMEAAYKEIDLRDFDPGRYFLKVVVTDLNSGETAAKETLFGVGE